MAIETLTIAALLSFASKLAFVEEPAPTHIEAGSIALDCEHVFLDAEARTHIERLVGISEIIMLGENHGRWEAPCIFLEIVQISAEYGEVSVGIELPRRFNDFIDMDNCENYELWDSEFRKYRPRDLRGNEAIRSVTFAIFDMHCTGQVRELAFIGGVTDEASRSLEMRVSDYRLAAINLLTAEQERSENRHVVIVFGGTAWNYDTREEDRDTSRSLCARTLAEGTQTHCTYIADGASAPGAIERSGPVGARFVLQSSDRFDVRGRRYDSIIELQSRTPARTVPREN